MKRLILVLGGVFLCFAFLTTGVFAAAEKFAYVDLSRLFGEYGKTKTYDKTLNDKQTAYDAEREKKINEIKQFQEKMNLLSEKEKEAKKTELEEKIKTLQEFDRQKQTDLRKEFSDKKVELVKDIEDVVKQYAEKEGFSFVFNEAGIAYNAKSLDITDKVLDILNKGYKK